MLAHRLVAMMVSVRCVGSLLTLLLPGLVPSFAATPLDFLENRAYQEVPASEALLRPSPARPIVDLNGAWQYRLPGDAEWGTVQIPSCYTYTGTVEFRRSFLVDSLMAGRLVRLVVLGINYRCAIWVNGEIIGSHTGGYGSFTLDVPKRVLRNHQPNVIDIHVENDLALRGTIPVRPGVNGWRNYGGIFREIYLVGYPLVSVTDVTVTPEFTPDYSAANVEARIRIRNFGELEVDSQPPTSTRITSAAQVGFGVELVDPDGGAIAARFEQAAPSVTVERQAEVQARLHLANPQVWEPRRPKRYLLRTYLLDGGQRVDALEEWIGLRSITLAGGEVRVNGRPTRFDGLLYHEDAPGVGAAVNWQVLERDVIQMKNAGITLVQTGWYPGHPYLYQLCDKYGLFVLEGIPIWQVPSATFRLPAFQALARNYLREMIQRDRNHPSILGWGIGYEFDSSDEAARPLVEDLYRTARELDPRPVYFASRFWEDERCADLVDLACLNSYTHDRQAFQHQMRAWAARYPDKPVFITRYGCDVFPANFDGGYADPTSVAHQAKFVEEFQGIVRGTPEADGSILWSFADWWGARPRLTNGEGTPPYLNALGIVDYERRERPAYAVLKSLLSGDSLPALFMGTYQPPQPYLYHVAGFGILALVILLARTRGRFAQNFQRSVFNLSGLFSDLRDQRLFPLRQTLALAVLLSAVCATFGAATLHYFRRNPYFDVLVDHLVVNPHLKGLLGRLAWHPEWMLLTGTGGVLAGMVVLTLLLAGSASVVRGRFSLERSFHLVTWSGSVFLLLTPIAMTTYALLAYAGAVVALALLLGVFQVWYGSRLLRGFSICTRTAPRRVGIPLGLIAAVTVGYAAYHFGETHGTWQFFRFFALMLENR